MIIASVYGRLSRDPDQRTTKAGRPMTVGNLAVSCGKPDDEQTLWLSVLAFGDQADQLARCAKGESVSVFGKVTRSTFTGQDGHERESWSLMVDGLVTTRSARPSGGKKRSTSPPGPAVQAPDRMRADPRDPDDGLPWGGG